MMLRTLFRAVFLVKISCRTLCICKKKWKSTYYMHLPTTIGKKEIKAWKPSALPSVLHFLLL